MWDSSPEPDAGQRRTEALLKLVAEAWSSFAVGPDRRGTLLAGQPDPRLIEDARATCENMALVPQRLDGDGGRRQVAAGPSFARVRGQCGGSHECRRALRGSLARCERSLGKVANA